jgi:hypothetical protein
MRGGTARMRASHMPAALPASIPALASGLIGKNASKPAARDAADAFLRQIKAASGRKAYHMFS